MPIELKRLRDGDIQIICETKKQVVDLLALNKQTLLGYTVDVTTPASWNSVRGVISSPALRTLTDQEIIDCARPTDGIIAARHWLRTNHLTKLREPSNSVCIT